MAGTPDYFHGMDREYHSHSHDHAHCGHAEPLLPIKGVGTSKMITRNALEPLTSAIKAGASKVELGFLGQGKGSIFAGQLNPESIGEHERRAIRELAKVNDVELSTHATVGISGVAGMSREGLNEEERSRVINEIRRAIDFAADTAEGGAVVFHTGEFQRPTRYGKRLENEFEDFPGQFETETAITFVDQKGKILGSLRRDQPLTVPEKDEETGEWKVITRDWEQVKEDAKEHGRSPDEELGFHFMNQRVRESEEKIEELNASLTIQETELEHAKSRGSPGALVKRYEDRIDNINKQIALAEHQKQQALDDRDKRNIVPLEEVALRKSVHSIAQAAVHAFDKTRERKLPKPIFVAPENLFPSAFGAHPDELKELITTSRDEMVKLLTEKSLKEKTVSQGKEKVIERHNPFFRKGVSKKDAEKVAEQHIKATFDIGHAYLWRKYFRKKGGETPEQQDERFKKWLLTQAKKLKESKIIGHIHVSDNFGYEDEHLTPGAGKAPINEFLQIMRGKENEKLDLVVEPGAQDPTRQWEALYGGWRLFGHSMAAPSVPFRGVSATLQGAGSTYWSGRSPPSYMFGEMMPSQEYRGHPFWSGLGLE